MICCGSIEEAKLEAIKIIADEWDVKSITFEYSILFGWCIQKEKFTEQEKRNHTELI